MLRRSAYPLSEVSKEDVVQYRLFKGECLIIKINDKLFLTECPEDITIHSFGPSICGTCSKRCKGCTKANTPSLGDCLESHNFSEAVQMSDRLENYDFITFAVETFCSSKSESSVLLCKNYLPLEENWPPERKPSILIWDYWVSFIFHIFFLLCFLHLFSFLFLVHLHFHVL